MSLISATQVPQSISNAIKRASKATGTDFNYLLKTAGRESSFNKSAKAKSSSAAGLFQFIESTWLKTVKDAGNKFGLDKYTPHIFKTRSGRHYVPNKQLRQEILQLRYNPEISATMAGAFTQKNSQFMASELGRKPSQGELYIAHFLGPNGASNLISQVNNKPNTRADRLFPNAARANKSIFYSHGKPRSVSQVYKVLVRDHAKLQASGIAAVSTSAPSNVAAAPAIPKAIAPANVSSSTNSPAAAPLWKTIVTPAGQAPLSTQLAQMQQIREPEPAKSAKSVEEPVTFYSFPPRPDTNNANPPVQKVSLYPPMPVPLDGFSGVEAVITPNPLYGAGSDRTAGLAGQKSSPIAKHTKVAALTHTRLKIAPRSVSDAVPGSVGSWATIVQPLANEQQAKASSQSEDQNRATHVDEAKERSKNRRDPRASGLLEQSNERNSSRQRVQTAMVNDRLNDDFWMQMSLDSN